MIICTLIMRGLHLCHNRYGANCTSVTTDMVQTAPLPQQIWCKLHLCHNKYGATTAPVTTNMVRAAPVTTPVTTLHLSQQIWCELNGMLHHLVSSAGDAGGVFEALKMA
eukprot:1140028-Pelagomonas_calceolata.AAC.1